MSAERTYVGTLDSLHVTPGADAAGIWAAFRELEMRQRRYRFLREGGLSGAIGRMAESMARVTEVLVGIFP